MNFSDNKLKEVQRIIEFYPQGKQKSAVIPVLHLAQEEFGGWLSTETMDYVASLLNLKPIEVYEVATFYSMYNLKPVGKYLFEVCQTGPCMLNGSDDIVAYIYEKLGIENVDAVEISPEAVCSRSTAGRSRTSRASRASSGHCSRDRR